MTEPPQKSSTKPQVWRILDLVNWGTEYFSQKKISNARLEIEWLLCHVLNMERVHLYVEFERPMNQQELAHIKALVKRRAAGEPFQYILGKADFYGYDMKVTPAVLIPRPETEVIIEVLKMQQTPGTILDMGTGSGCIAIVAALELPAAKVSAVDVSPEALAVARENAAHHKVQVDFQQMDILLDKPQGSYDVVLCNPPYVAADEMAGLDSVVKDHEPTAALTDDGDGLTFYRRLAELFPEIVNDGGAMIVEIGPTQAAEVTALFAAVGASCTTHKDLQGDDRVVEVK